MDLDVTLLIGLNVQVDMQVWDYAGDGYVHRLVQSKGDGKLVEVPAPVGECSGSHSVNASNSHEGKHEEKDVAIVASKLDAIAFEYNHLLTAQLESQRQYFEVHMKPPQLLLSIKGFALEELVEFLSGEYG